MGIRYLACCWALLFQLESSVSFSLGPTHTNIVDRRAAIAKFVSVPIGVSVLSSNPLIACSASTDVGNVCTVVIDSPESSNIGVQFVDTQIDGKVYATIDKIETDSLAAQSGAKPGMVLLTRDSATKSSSKNIEFRLRNGPHPFVLQFTTPEELVKISESDMQSQIINGRALGPYDRIDVKTVRKSDNCNEKAKSGDTVTISYEARMVSSTGPIYDSTFWRQNQPAIFELGKGVALPGVEIGINGMCVDEVREIDVPTSLGYGKFGSPVFDIPGDIRLFWRVELLDLKKGKRQLRII